MIIFIFNEMYTTTKIVNNKLKTYLESSQKIMGGIIYTQSGKKGHLLG